MLRDFEWKLGGDKETVVIAINYFEQRQHHNFNESVKRNGIRTNSRKTRHVMMFILWLMNFKKIIVVVAHAASMENV